MAIQAKPDRSLRLVLSGASADVTLVISDSAERPVATMVVAPAQLREIVQSFGNILRLVEGEAASGALPVNAPWQKTGFVVDAPAWRATQEGATGLVVLSLQIAPDAWWSFTLPPEQARELGQRLSASVGGDPAVAVSAVAALPQGFEAAGPGTGSGGDRTARSGGSAVAAPPEGAEAAAPGGAGAGPRTESAA